MKAILTRNSWKRRLKSPGMLLFCRESRFERKTHCSLKSLSSLRKCWTAPDDLPYSEDPGFANESDGAQSVICTQLTNIIRSDPFNSSKKIIFVQQAINLESKELLLRGQLFDKIETVFPAYCQTRDVVYQNLRAFHCWEESVEPAILAALMSARPSGAQPNAGDAVLRAAYWDTISGIYASKTATPPLVHKTLNDLREGQHTALPDMEALE